MPCWRVSGHRLKLTHSRRTSGGKVVTKYLQSWTSIQEAESDLTDPEVVANLTRKVAPSKFDASSLLGDLRMRPKRYTAVQRYSRALAVQVAVPNARVNWDLGGAFWRPLSEDIMRQMGLLAAPDTPVNRLASDEVKRALGRFRLEVETATRDLQGRLRKTKKQYSLTAGGPPEVRAALLRLGINEPISEVTVKRVTKQFHNIVMTLHPDLGGNKDAFVGMEQSRDMVVRYLEATERK